MSGGNRFNSGKLPLCLISPYATEGNAKVLQHGAEKYAPRNWEKGLSWVETLESMKRHILEIEKGNDFDNGPGGSGLPHIDHIQCNAMFLSHFFHTKTGTDDRPKAPHQMFPESRAPTAVSGRVWHYLRNGYYMCGASRAGSTYGTLEFEAVTCTACRQNAKQYDPTQQQGPYPPIPVEQALPPIEKIQRAGPRERIYASQQAWEEEMTKRRQQSDARGNGVVEEVARIDHAHWLMANKHG